MIACRMPGKFQVALLYHDKHMNKVACTRLLVRGTVAQQQH